MEKGDLFYMKSYAWNYIWMMRKRFYYLTHVESWTHNNIVWGLKNLCSRLHQYSGFFWGAIFFPFRTSNYLPHAKRTQKSPKVPSIYYVSTCMGREGSENGNFCLGTVHKGRLESRGVEGIISSKYCRYIVIYGKM